MAESIEVQALEKISTEIEDSQIKITLSSQCIKAQAFLVDKLRKQSERQREICNFISSSNLKLQAEVSQAELEIKSLMVGYETIKSSNVELKKECLMIKERKSEIEIRIANGEKRYEDLWSQAKERYESIPFIQMLLTAQNKSAVLKENIDKVENTTMVLAKEIDEKKRLLATLDKKRIVELADYIINILPKTIKEIEDKRKVVMEMSKKIDDLQKQRANIMEKPLKTFNIALITETRSKAVEKNKTVSVIEDGWFNLCQDNERESLMMPKIQLFNQDFDVLSAKLDKIKVNKVDFLIVPTAKRADPIQAELFSKQQKRDDDFPLLFPNNTPIDLSEGGNQSSDKYSKRKLINILEDIKLDKNDVFELVSKTNSDKLIVVDKIGADSPRDDKNDADNNNSEKDEVIEEIDMSKSSNNLLIPPSQFLDYREDDVFATSQQQVEVIVHMSGTSAKNSQEISNKKRVSFDLPMSIQEITNEFVEDVTRTENKEPNDTMESQINISIESESSYTQIKDMILKKHNLDLSPQFVYAKNNTIQLKNNEDVITSKFFKANDGKTENTAKITELEQESNTKENNTKQTENLDNPINMEVDNVMVPSPKATPIQKSERSVTGLLFNHGAHGIPDSLNVSISTTGFEEGDGDFPHCIDSSLLLSPQADLHLSMSSDNPEVTSQEVPNFLSGLRKTGLSFFGQSSADSKPDGNDQLQANNFNFNFGGDEKKGRGGLFSMFHM